MCPKMVFPCLAFMLCISVAVAEHRRELRQQVYLENGCIELILENLANKGIDYFDSFSGHRVPKYLSIQAKDASGTLLTAQLSESGSWTPLLLHGGITTPPLPLTVLRPGASKRASIPLEHLLFGIPDAHLVRTIRIRWCVYTDANFENHLEIQTPWLSVQGVSGQTSSAKSMKSYGSPESAEVGMEIEKRIEALENTATERWRLQRDRANNLAATGRL